MRGVDREVKRKDYDDNSAKTSVFDAETVYSGSEDENGNRHQNGAAEGNGASPTFRRVRCGACEGCRSVDCGECAACKNMPKYGGTGSAKQVCVKRRCQNLQPPGPTSQRSIRRGQSADDLLGSLAKFIDRCGGDGDAVRARWRVCIGMRKAGATAGARDVYFYNEHGQRFRSRAEVARALGLADETTRATKARRLSK